MELLIRNLLKNMESNTLRGISSGFEELDNILQGFEKGSLYTLAGSPSMGKTSLALNIMRNVAIDSKIPVAYFSYEMTEDQIVSKLISIGSEINNNKLCAEKLRKDELENLNNEVLQLTSSPIFIESLDFCTIDSLAEKCEELISKNQIELIIIDDIQRIEIDIKSRKFAANREQEISHNVRMLKSYAMKWRIPIIIISKLNRGPETRGGDKRPLLPDLRDSGFH
jgi:replicative DNA helicase